VVVGRVLQEYLSSITDVKAGDSIQLDGVRQPDGEAAAAAIAADDDYQVSFVEF
jgi:hypothetical protein